MADLDLRIADLRWLLMLKLSLLQSLMTDLRTTAMVVADDIAAIVDVGHGGVLVGGFEGDFKGEDRERR